jgi:large subunit ribosomal protein L14e
MALMDVGRVCRKTRGRDAGGFCAIVENQGKDMALVDGRDVRRRKVNLNHLEPTAVGLDFKKGASTEEVVSALKDGKLIR